MLVGDPHRVVEGQLLCRLGLVQLSLLPVVVTSGESRRKSTLDVARANGNPHCKNTSPTHTHTHTHTVQAPIKKTGVEPRQLMAEQSLPTPALRDHSPQLRAPIWVNKVVGDALEKKNELKRPKPWRKVITSPQSPVA